MKRLFPALLTAMIWLCWFLPASAEKRVALVIGNSSYLNTAPLTNPKNDAADMAEALKALGFEVIFETNIEKRSMDFALAKFARATRDAEAALFFYAGHGMQFQGTNFLMPVDARLEDEVSPRFEMTRVEEVMAAMESARVRLVLLDACRNNPLAERLVRKVSSSSRSAGPVRGFVPPEQLRGMVVAYATQANDVAADGEGRNSPFTASLLKQMQIPGIEIGQMFRRVTQDVHTATKGKQVPELSVSLLSDFFLNRGESDIQAWARVRNSSDPKVLREFITTFPSSFLVTDAKTLLERLERASSASTETDAARRRERELQAQIERMQNQQKLAEEAAARREKTARDEAARIERERAENELARTLMQEKQLRDKELADRERKLAEEAAKREHDMRKRLEEIEAASIKSARDVVDRERQLLEVQKKTEADRKNQEIALAERERELRTRIESQASTQSALERDRLLKEALTAAEREQDAKEKALKVVRESEMADREKALKAANDSALKLREEVERLRIESEKAREELQNARKIAANSPAQLAALGPAELQPPVPVMPADKLIREIKTSLKRIGCFDGTIDSNPSTPQTQRSMETFAKYANLDAASVQFDLNTFNRLKSMNERICPLVCGVKATEKDGKCIAKTCRSGEMLDSDGDCVDKPRPKAVAERAEPVARRAPAAAPSGGGGGGGARCFNFGGKRFCE